VTVLAIRRGTEVIENPSGETDLKAGDDVVVIGTPDKIRDIAGIFRASVVSSDAEGDDGQGEGSGLGENVSNRSDSLR